MSKFSVWELYAEGFTGEWDKPDRVVDATNHEQAAIAYADRSRDGDDEVAVLVRDDATGELVEIEMHKAWELDMYKKTTAAEQKP